MDTSLAGPVRAIGPSRAGRSSYQIAIGVSGVEDVNRVLKGIDLRASDLTQCWPEVDKAFAKIVAAQFASEGAHGGEKWAPLAPRTQQERRRLGYGPEHPILRRTNTLYRSLTQLNSDAISVHAPQYYARGSGVPYFVYHQSAAPRKGRVITRHFLGGRGRMGSKIERRTYSGALPLLPRRPVLALTFDDATALVAPIRVWLTAADPATTFRSQALRTANAARGRT